MNLTWLETSFTTCFLVFVRLSGFFFLFPLSANRQVPVVYRAGLGAISALALASAVDPFRGPAPDLISLALLVSRELAIGLALGYLSLLLLTVGQVAGQFADYEMGFGMVQVIDPQFGQRVPLIGNFLYLLGILVFLALNGHHILLATLHSSFSVLPLGSGLPTGVCPGIFSFVSWMFGAALRVSLPVLGALFITSAALGILARTMPQLNVFVVGLPLKILVGMAVLAAALPIYSTVLEYLYRDGTGRIARILLKW